MYHEKVRNQRKDYIHKLTRKIADTYDAVGVEDLDMKAMSRCLNFGKSVMDNSYGMFRDILTYKLYKQGAKKKIRPYPDKVIKMPVSGQKTIAGHARVACKYLAHESH